MLALDRKISSDELNRAIFAANDEHELINAIQRIRTARSTGDIGALGQEVIRGTAKNDRIIPWMSLASFGWILFPDKRTGTDPEYYEIPSSTYYVIREAARIRHRHRSFVSVQQYVRYISRSAALPKDLR